MTVSPVLVVTIWTPRGSTIQAVLKLYDRRFGIDLRDTPDGPVPHAPANEAQFQAFVGRGMIAPFLRELEEKNKQALVPSKAWHSLDGSAEGCAMYEAALWQECNEHFRCETEAYARLSDLQEKSIPHMLAHVRLVLGDSDIPPDLRQMACYFEVKGVLLQHIDGYNLEDIATTSLAPSDPTKWQGTIQSAANAAHDINRRGIIMQDCSPRNVVVDGRSHMPYIIDLAQCLFEDQLMKRWHELGWYEDEDWDPDVEYWERVQGKKNPVAIGLVVGSRVKKTKGVTVDIKYPDYDEIIANIKRSKAARGERHAGTTVWIS